jgi:chromate reductase, NAD(P)H dehydrogenase (quinone)
MPAPKILVIPGSQRMRSLNARLAALAAKELTLADAQVTRISLIDYPLPIYDADVAERAGPPQNALKLKRLICAQQGVLLVSPEYNASVPPLLKNALDWISVVRERGEPSLYAYQHRVFALAGATPRTSGVGHALLALRQILAVGCRALVIPEQLSVPAAELAFDEADGLRDARLAGELKHLVRRLADTARLLAAGELVG